MIDEDKRVAVYEKSGGECSYCEKEIVLYNRDRASRGAWEVEHQVPRAKNGTDHLNNLVAACWTCNLDKGVGSARTHRRTVAGERTARTSRRRWRTAGNAMIPGLAVAGLTWAYMKATGPTDAETKTMTPEDRQRYFWKMLLIPLSIGLAAIGLILIVSEMKRSA